MRADKYKDPLEYMCWQLCSRVGSAEISWMECCLDGEGGLGSIAVLAFFSTLLGLRPELV